MRRLLPILFCVASTGLAACDQDSGPTPDDAQALYDEVRAAPFPVPVAFDTDVELRRSGGGVVPDFVIINSVAADDSGTPIQVISNGGIASPDGELLCSFTSSGAFSQLRDADNDVIFSALGPFVFEGQPQLAGKNAFQQAQTLMAHLRFSYDFDLLVEGPVSSGEEMVEANVPIQFSSSNRKLVIASLVDGYCGSEGLDTP
jgi:hypothetical protein